MFNFLCKLFGNGLDWQGLVSMRTFTKNQTDYRDFLDETQTIIDNPKTALEFVRKQMTYKSEPKDTWITAQRSLLKKEGDCEEHAFVLASVLINAKKDARVCIGYLRGQGHAWVLYFDKKNRPYVLDAAVKEPMWRAELVQGYEPILSFDRSMFYTHAAEQKIQAFLLGRIILPTGRTWFYGKNSK